MPFRCWTGLPAGTTEVCSPLGWLHGQCKPVTPELQQNEMVHTDSSQLQRVPHYSLSVYMASAKSVILPNGNPQNYSISPQIMLVSRDLFSFPYSVFCFFPVLSSMGAHLLMPAFLPSWTNTVQGPALTCTHLLDKQLCAERDCLGLTASEKAERNHQHHWESSLINTLLLLPDKYARMCPIRFGAKFSSMIFLQSSENYNIPLLVLLSLLAHPCL